MVYYSQFTTAFALCVVMQFCQASPAIDLEPCPSGSGRPRTYASLSSPAACEPDTSTTLIAYTFDDANNVGLDSGMYANDAVAYSVEVSTDQVKQGSSSAIMTNVNYL